MTQDIHSFGQIVRSRRLDVGMSANELARRAGVNTTTITRLEAGESAVPRADTLRNVALALGLPVSDLLARAEYLEAGELPTISPYLRAKYGYLSDSAQAEMTAAFRDIATRHGYDPDQRGPQPHEDEH